MFNLRILEISAAQYCQLNKAEKIFLCLHTKYPLFTQNKVLSTLPRLSQIIQVNWSPLATRISVFLASNWFIPFRTSFYWRWKNTLRHLMGVCYICQWHKFIVLHLLNVKTNNMFRCCVLNTFELKLKYFHIIHIKIIYFNCLLMLLIFQLLLFVKVCS